MDFTKYIIFNFGIMCKLLKMYSFYNRFAHFFTFFFIFIFLFYSILLLLSVISLIRFLTFFFFFLALLVMFLTLLKLMLIGMSTKASREYTIGLDKNLYNSFVGIIRNKRNLKYFPFLILLFVAILHWTMYFVA